MHWQLHLSNQMLTEVLSIAHPLETAIPTKPHTEWLIWEQSNQQHPCFSLWLISLFIWVTLYRILLWNFPTSGYFQVQFWPQISLQGIYSFLDYYYVNGDKQHPKYFSHHWSWYQIFHLRRNIKYYSAFGKMYLSGNHIQLSVCRGRRIRNLAFHEKFQPCFCALSLGNGGSTSKCPFLSQTIAITATATHWHIVFLLHTAFIMIRKPRLPFTDTHTHKYTHTHTTPQNTTIMGIKARKGQA